MWKPQGIYADFLLNQPVIFFGENSINGLAAMPGAKISVIHGSSLGQDIKDSLSTVFKKKAVYFNERSWKGEPDLESLSGTIALLEQQQPDVIIAIGGGAVIDGAKLCRLFYEFPSFTVGEMRLNQLDFSTRFVAIPTTIGSGAEASSAAVYVNNAEHRKEMIVSHDLQPEAVVFEPKLVADAPIDLVVSSGVDAMAHIIEGYVSNRDNTLANVNAEMGLRILAEELGKSNVSKMNFEKLQYAGYLGGIVQNHCIVGAAHGIAHQLTADGFSHGQAVSILLPAVMRVNAQDKVARAKYDNLCYGAGIPSFDMFTKGIETIVAAAGLANKKSDLKSILEKRIKDDSFIANVANDQGAQGNPVEINREYLEKLLGEI